MAAEITAIRAPMPLGLGAVNCYLLRAAAGFVLVDTGAPSGRAFLERELERLGCRPGDLRLVVLTHGDFDHTGGAAHLRRVYGAKIAMHPADAGMAEQADMFSNRGGGNALLKKAVPALFGFGKDSRFSPDILVEDGFDLTGYGLEARLLHLPGHSAGSIGLLTGAGDLFCGDLLMNEKGKLTLGYGDPPGFAASLARVRSLPLRRIYPGHGQPFGPAELEKL